MSDQKPYPRVFLSTDKHGSQAWTKDAGVADALRLLGNKIEEAVRVSDISAAISAAVQVEKEATLSLFDEPLDECTDAAELREFYKYRVRLRPAPAVDVLGIVREYVEAHAGLDNEFEVHSKESIAAETRFESAYNALRALVDGKPKENDNGIA